MTIKKNVGDHLSLISTIVLLSPLFIAYQYSKTGWNLFGRSLILLIVVVQIARTHGRISGIRSSSTAVAFSKRTLLSYGYICFSAILISIWATGDAIYSFINFTIFTSVFAYLALLCWRSHKIERLVAWVLFFSFVSALWTIIESVNIAILPFAQDYVDFATSVNEDNHLTASLVLDGSIRAFGIYSDAFVNGYFMSVGAALSLSKFLYSSSKQRLWGYFFLFAFFVIAIYLTLTRNCYLALFTSCLVVGLFRCSIVKKINASFFVFGWLVSAIFLMMGSVYYVFFYSGFDLENTVSSRVFTWSVVFAKYIANGSVFGTLFGYGVFQWGGEHQDTDLWALDNLFIQIFMSSGIVGLMVFVFWWAKVSMALFRIAQRRRDYFSVSTCSIFVQFVIVGVYNSILYANPIVPLMLIMAFLVMYREDLLARN